jgi:hypothetical protein
VPPCSAAPGKMRRGGAGSWAERSPDLQQVLLGSHAPGAMSNKTMSDGVDGGRPQHQRGGMQRELVHRQSSDGRSH